MQSFIDELVIREFSMDDENLVKAFFDQMGSETKVFFDRGDGNRKNAMRFFCINLWL